jgi:hypothetical protein
MIPGQCYEKTQSVKERVKELKEEYKDNKELYKLLTAFCEEEYNPLGWKKVKPNEKD